MVTRLASILALLTASWWSSFVGGAQESFSDLPILKVRGDHFQIGLQTGEHFRDEILTAIKNNTLFTEKVLPYNSTGEGAAVFNNYHLITEFSFPEYLDEIRGMAQGAQLSYSELFLWNMQFEYSLLLEPRVGRLPEPSCSDFYLVSSDGRALIGHNEDGALIANTTSYIIDAEVTSDGGAEVTERFTALCYAGQLCSTAFGYSETAGKVFSSNALFPKNLDTRFVGRNFINRGLMNTKLADVESFLTQFTCSSGFSYNAATLDGQKVMNFEVSSAGVVAMEIKGYSYHFNMYLHSNVPQYSDPSSLHRLSRVKQLPQPTNSSDILALLGDTADTDYPIYRTATGPDRAATLATALFDLPKSNFSIYRGNPSLAQQPVIIIQMNQTVQS